MTDFEFTKERLAVESQLEREHHSRQRILQYAQESGNADLAIAVIDECNMILTNHRECVERLECGIE